MPLSDRGLRDHLLVYSGREMSHRLGWLLTLGAAAFVAWRARVPARPYLPQALFEKAEALEAAGDLEGAKAARGRLRREYAASPLGGAPP